MNSQPPYPGDGHDRHYNMPPSDTSRIGSSTEKFSSDTAHSGGRAYDCGVKNVSFSNSGCIQTGADYTERIQTDWSGFFRTGSSTNRVHTDRNGFYRQDPSPTRVHTYCRIFFRTDPPQLGTTHSAEDSSERISTRVDTYCRGFFSTDPPQLGSTHTAEDYSERIRLKSGPHILQRIIQNGSVSGVHRNRMARPRLLPAVRYSLSGLLIFSIVFLHALTGMAYVGVTAQDLTQKYRVPGSSNKEPKNRNSSRFNHSPAHSAEDDKEEYQTQTSQSSSDATLVWPALSICITVVIVIVCCYQRARYNSIVEAREARRRGSTMAPTDNLSNTPSRLFTGISRSISRRRELMADRAPSYNTAVPPESPPPSYEEACTTSSNPLDFRPAK